MNSGERMALAMLRDALPDRVPVMCQLAIGHYFLNTSLSPIDIWFTSESFAEAMVIQSLNHNLNKQSTTPQGDTFAT